MSRGALVHRREPAHHVTGVRVRARIARPARFVRRERHAFGSVTLAKPSKENAGSAMVTAFFDAALLAERRVARATTTRAATEAILRAGGEDIEVMREWG